MFLQRRINITVAHDVAGAAGGNLVDVHVETSLLVPRQETMIVVDLTALRLVMMTHVTAAAPWLPATITNHLQIVPSQDTYKHFSILSV